MTCTGHVIHNSISKAHTLNHLLYLTLTLQEATFLCSNQSRPETRQLETVPIPQSPLTLLKLASHKPAYYPALSCLFHRNHNKGSCPCFSFAPAFWPTLVLPCVALHGLVCPLLLGTVSNTLSFQSQWSPDLSAVLPTWIIIKPTF